MRLYGLTGGTGSGKSAAAKRFVQRGIPVIDADAVGHDAIAPGGSAEEAVRACFGPEILSCGRIDRKKLGEKIFREPQLRLQLNALVHPAIFMEVDKECRRLSAQGHDVAIFDAALLGENGVRDPGLAGLILVLAPRELRIRWLIAARGLSEEEIVRRMDAQTPPESKRAIADWIIENDGALEMLHRRVDEIAEVLYGEAIRP